MNKISRKIELLAPAKNLESGIIAINHGADAVYIGADCFGARQAAGNTISDIASLVTYAHNYGVKVYVTVNTIIYEHELAKARDLLLNLINIEVDAILVQDMAIVEMMQEIANDPKYKGMKLPELHASTQTDNRCKEKVEWLRNAGFSRVVLARELSLDEIKDIHNAAGNVELEVFVHGALCVSYSGACYASQYCFGRSANRGECAQFCRLAFDLKDSRGEIIKRASHLLSLKDMQQIDRIGDIIEAGATSLKIEGRLKDTTYIKNVVAAYSKKINEFIAQHPGKYYRSSYGHVSYNFEPHIEKTFNRGFTHYFLEGRRDDISSFDTPKAMGEYVGYVKEIRRGSLNVAGTATFANGDGLCFFNEDKKLEGFRVNRAENNRLYPLTMPHNLHPGMALYRNNDMEFERIMSGNTAERRIDVTFTIGLSGNNVYLQAKDETGRISTAFMEETLQEAQKPQRDNIIRQLQKLGNTLFSTSKIEMKDGIANLFIPSSKLAALRREVLKMLDEQPLQEEGHIDTKKNTHVTAADATSIEASRINAANVSNHIAEKFYEEHGISHVPAAFETTNGKTKSMVVYGTRNDNTPLMTCRYCLRYAMGFCVKRGGTRPTWKEPLFLESSDGRQVRILFNCAKCQMEIYSV